MFAIYVTYTFKSIQEPTNQASSFFASRKKEGAMIANPATKQNIRNFDWAVGEDYSRRRSGSSVKVNLFRCVCVLGAMTRSEEIERRERWAERERSSDEKQFYARGPGNWKLKWLFD